MIKQASRLTCNGIPVFPCNADKSPATQHGFKDASIHVDDFRWHAGSLIGVPTGILFDVLDIDLYHDDAKEWYQRHRHELPLTRMHHTRSGGIHFFFKPDPRVSNSASKLGPHIDTRAKGGYIIWWACHGCAVDNKDEFAHWAEWLIPAAPPARHVPTQCQPISEQAVLRRVGGILTIVANATKGSRNSKVYWAAKRFEEMIMSGLIDRGSVEHHLFNIAQLSGLDGNEILTAMRGLRS